MLNNYLEFPYCGQVFKILRERTTVKTDETTLETEYGITSLTPEQADLNRLHQLIRQHWSIENRSHYVRDVTFDEDRHQVRTKNGPQMMACLRNFAISMLRIAGHDNIAKAVRMMAAASHKCLRMIGL